MRVKLPRPASVQGGREWAAVAILLFDDMNSVLMIKRANAPWDPWSGDVAFPGGRFKDADGDLISTAIRECREETGIALSRDLYTGILSVHSPSNDSSLKVLPVVFSVKSERLRELRINRAEVEDAFLFDLDMKGARRIRVERLGKEREAIEYKGYIIWGMTYRVLMELLERVGGEGQVGP